MHRIKRYVGFCVMLFLLLAYFCLADETSYAKSKTENLRLNLTGTNSYQNNVNVHTIRLLIINEGKDKKTLVAQWPDEYFKGDYIDFLRNHVTLTAIPVIYDHAQYGEAGGLTDRISAQPMYQLDSKNSLLIEWNDLKRRSLPIGNVSYLFPSDGQYLIQAHVNIVTTQGENISLVSNEQPLIFGNSTVKAKPSSAKIIALDKEKNIVSLNVGSKDKIETGDTFHVFVDLQSGYDLKVKKIHEDICEADVEVRVFNKDRSTSWFPKKNMEAFLMPKDDHRY